MLKGLDYDKMAGAGGGVQVGVTEKVCAMFLKYLESHSEVIYKL